MESNIFEQLLDLVAPLSPVIGTILAILGAIVVLAVVVDGLIPDEKDGGFSKKLFEIPILGVFLKALVKFSPINYKR